MTSTAELIAGTNSKRTCLYCEQKKLLTTDTYELPATYLRYQARTAVPPVLPIMRLSDRLHIDDRADEFDNFMYYHCMNCGGEFSESEQQRDLRDSTEEGEKSDTPWNTGILILLAMLVTILVIRLNEGGTPSFPEGGRRVIESVEER